jgi:UPF0755 protein
MKRILLTLFLLAVAVAAGAFLDFQHYITSPVGEDEESIVYEVRKGASLGVVARELHAQGLIERPLYWKLLARLEGKTRSIRLGEFRLSGAMSPSEILDTLVSGATVQYSLTVLEGWNFRQLMAAVAAHPQLIATDITQDPDRLMTHLGQPGMHPEGWFYPDTYHFPKGTTDLAFLERAYGIMASTLEQEWSGREPDLPLDSAYEALILASIVEKETAVASERPMIAAVFLSRLRKGMRLQTDPTVIYGMGERFDGNIRKSDLLRDTPYNTYTRAGLPPTPIALPSGAAIHAVLHPAETDALYFVAKGDGSHHFSATYDEHRDAVIQFQLGGNASRYKGSQ